MPTGRWSTPSSQTCSTGTSRTPWSTRQPGLPGDGHALVRKLFTEAPLGIEPYDFGFLGALGSDEVQRLRHVLEGAVGASAARVEQERRSWDMPLGECADRLEQNRPACWSGCGR